MLRPKSDLNNSAIVNSPRGLRLNLGDISPRRSDVSDQELNSYRELRSDRYKPARK